MPARVETVVDENRFAFEIASRLGEIVPAWMSVIADRGTIVLTVPGHAPSFLPIFQAARPLYEHIQLLASNILSAVQDVITLHSTRPWPPVQGEASHLPLPGVAIRDGELWMWYRNAEEPTICLRPILLKDVVASTE